ncbi:hypothetical protein [Actinomadura formosensis]|uniref:hypothetical protein n=1 Tax=Actinomadura formosensis TaxID=60706 RepID=UPI001041B731|nr:hypothetical protein [Actinomadura formosensis]
MGERTAPVVVTWYGRATGAWWALVPSPDGVRLVEAANPRELRTAIENPAAWPWPQRKFLPAASRR